MRSTFRYLTSVLFVAVVLQVMLAAFGAFDAVHKSKHVPITRKTIDNGFGPHSVLGYVIVLVMVLLVITAATGGVGPGPLRMAGALLACGILQIILGVVSESAPVVGVLHGLNALAIFSLSGLLAHRTWAAERPAARAVASPAT
jgi:heme A synthase